MMSRTVVIGPGTSFFSRNRDTSGAVREKGRAFRDAVPGSPSTSLGRSGIGWDVQMDGMDDSTVFGLEEIEAVVLPFVGNG